MTPQPVPAWFHNLVIEGVQMLYALSLQGCPSAETLPLTTQVWINTLWDSVARWDEATDARRLREAFHTLARQAERWPAPAHVMDVIPRRPEAPRLPTPKLSPDERAEAVRKIADIKRLFLRSTKEQ